MRKQCKNTNQSVSLSWWCFDSLTFLESFGSCLESSRLCLECSVWHILLQTYFVILIHFSKFLRSSSLTVGVLSGLFTRPPAAFLARIRRLQYSTLPFQARTVFFCRRFHALLLYACIECIWSEAVPRLFPKRASFACVFCVSNTSGLRTSAYCKKRGDVFAFSHSGRTRKTVRSGGQRHSWPSG